MAKQTPSGGIERSWTPDGAAATGARGAPVGPAPPTAPTARSRLRDGAIVIIATVFTVMTIGVAMLITRGQRVGIVGGAPGPTPAVVPSAPARLVPPGPPAPAPTTAGPAGTGGAADAVPAGFLGTWSGTLAASDGSRSGEDAVTVRPGRIGADSTTELRSDTGTSGAHPLCPTAWTLLSATAHQLSFSSRPLPGAPAGCPTGTAEQTLTRNPDGTVTHTWSDPATGTLTGVLDQGA
ncbi:hypothetical protein [Streptacidiphilus carbonis]|uniref:hypothetical protein n=1 Tax=Streptacidiphilus carbonis TaxID=105422 RepID=UPI0005A651B4|nr:hypothetical protein [Streptacidiphilus carbonis]